MARTTPVACTLTPADLAAQAKRWEHLIARAMTEHAETAYGLRICFCPEPGVEDELRTLAAAENDCCPWATWTVESSAGTISLDVRSTADGIATLHAMFTSPAPASAAGVRSPLPRWLDRSGVCLAVRSSRLDVPPGR